MNVVDDSTYLANLEVAIKKYEATLFIAKEETPTKKKVSREALSSLAQCLRASSANRRLSAKSDKDIDYLSRLESTASHFEDIMHDDMMNSEPEKGIQFFSQHCTLREEQFVPLFLNVLLRKRILLLLAQAFRLLSSFDPSSKFCLIQKKNQEEINLRTASEIYDKTYTSLAKRR
eukprot:CAMPEP_0197314328 /NCGR_PEP_ID=MMETSP0891-20130614/33326_1 /TAXON_ID=44058 ORGANISM="Aureoumbra lagunensis, Strain CCMP1510" /NCGR_SAMPLE_ID=MMETSP0891 /ASSEMBLY_ACC=CAM_ASM_000534 /LENGTH=174 /DNA_ID=CAMNT_0042802723 /DNA_START=65 /DNA_END=588 /DNA_ORIENTATION=-